MAGYYIFNNIGIRVPVLRDGRAVRLGSVWYLVYNGLVIGTVFGYLIAVGRGANLLTYTAGHSPWELTGITVSGTAGLRMGWALIETGGRTRLGSLRAAGPALYRLVAGAAAMLAVAASIEGFWSASPVPVAGKAAFGLLGAVIVGGCSGSGDALERSEEVGLRPTETDRADRRSGSAAKAGRIGGSERNGTPRGADASFLGVAPRLHVAGSSKLDPRGPQSSFLGLGPRLHIAGSSKLDPRVSGSAVGGPETRLHVAGSSKLDPRGADASFLGVAPRLHIAGSSKLDPRGAGRLVPRRRTPTSHCRVERARPEASSRCPRRSR